MHLKLLNPYILLTSASINKIGFEYTENVKENKVTNIWDFFEYTLRLSL